MSEAVKPIDGLPNLLAWVGEDEMGSGKVGLKQGMTARGVTALAAVEDHHDRMEGYKPMLVQQSMKYGKTIRLVKYVPVEEIIVIEPENKK